jgi:hypothetical protein
MNLDAVFQQARAEGFHDTEVVVWVLQQAIEQNWAEDLARICRGAYEIRQNGPIQQGPQAQKTCKAP